MIATIGLPGTSCFTWTRVKDAKEAQEYRACWLENVGESQETLNAVRQGLLLTEKEALKARYQSGERIYAVKEKRAWRVVSGNWRKTPRYLPVS